MLLIPQLAVSGNLLLSAYSFDYSEINSVAIVLEKSRIDIVNENLGRDREGRFGLRFIIKAFEIFKLENTLRLKFTGRGEKTKVTLNLDRQGRSFKCRRIDTPPNGCETVWADNEQEAIVKCALIANNNNWLGGVPAPGSC